MQPQAENFFVSNASKQTIVCGQVRLAKGPLDRMRGLLGEHRLAADSGLWLRPSSGVHTCGMRFAIDIVALDKEGKVVVIAPCTEPWRVRGLHWKTRSVLELPCGQAARARVEEGDLLQFDKQSPA